MTQITSTTEILTRGVTEILPDRNSLAALLSSKKIRVFMGIDPTGSFLTLGHSVGLRKLQQFADLGHEVILLIGNGTVRIGDPTGRDSTRPVLSDEQIESNFKDWQAQASKILDFSKIKTVRNGDWLDKLTYSDIVKLMAQTTVQQLIERDMFQDRLTKGLPIFGHEIMYPLLQGYDSVAMDVDLEIGGTDQTFNMMMGRQLQKTYNGHEKWVLTTPIINGTDGRKMSKSFNNFVALTDEPSEMYGKLMRISDDMIIGYFTVLTDVPLSDIETMKKAMEQGTNPIEFKKKLALTITEMYHSESAALAAQTSFETVVQQGSAPEKMPIKTMTAGSYKISELAALVRPDISKSEINRLIQQGAVEVNNQKMNDPFAIFTLESEIVIKVGKRQYTKITPN